MRILAVLLLTGLTLLGQSATSTASLKFLEGMEGKYPTQEKLFSQAAMKSHLTALLKKDAALIPERFQVESAILRKDDMVSMSGNKAHQGGIDEAVIAVNTSTNEMWVWLKVKGVLKRYGPPRDPKNLPADTVTALSNMKAKNP